MLAQLNDCIGGLLHLGPNVITFRALLHLGPNVITFRILLHLAQLLHLGLQQDPLGFLRQFLSTSVNLILDLIFIYIYFVSPIFFQDKQ